MPAPESVVVVLDVADQHSLDRSMRSVLESGLPAIVVDPTRAEDLVLSVDVAADAAGSATVFVLCAGERLHDSASPIAADPEAALPLVPNPLAPAGPRQWEVRNPPRWQDLVLAPRPAAQPAVGSAATPKPAAQSWLRYVAHRRELERGSQLADPGQTLFDAVCLAWAGEHDAALARALGQATSLGAPDDLRIAAARIATASAAAIRRPDEAVQALLLWWSYAPSPTARAWARVLAALGSQHVAALTAILNSDAPLPDLTECLVPWLGRALDAFWRGAATEAEAVARRLLAAMNQRGRIDSADEVLQIWRLWRSTTHSISEMVDAWPECGDRGLLIVLEQAWQLEAPTAWDELARAYSAVHGPSEALMRVAASLAGVLPLESVITWETLRQQRRIRADSPLIGRSRDEATPPIDAVFAAAIAVQSGLGVAADRALTDASERLVSGEIARAVEMVRTAAPRAVPVLATALRSRSLGAEVTGEAPDASGDG